MMHSFLDHPSAERCGIHDMPPRLSQTQSSLAALRLYESSAGPVDSGSSVLFDSCYATPPFAAASITDYEHRNGGGSACMSPRLFSTTSTSGSVCPPDDANSSASPGRPDR